ncbi:hypothetical protein HMPREF0168_1700 [Bifidobacterium dentium ATCC 27679]|uniref:Uncharacterized protein n=1 Tax=Bifidobacterium dentium ATCC 27679 TaxID=871562 RepID=E0Q9Q2_9BIFI|nr:hypothetical protein HMPREF0168_1700 [Bifidobacterium dentium ATCC 27679]
MLAGVSLSDASDKETPVAYSDGMTGLAIRRAAATNAIIGEAVAQCMIRRTRGLKGSCVSGTTI